MEAKDTIKTYGELGTYCKQKGIKETGEGEIIAAQAEISYKAGREKVVEWVEGQNHHDRQGEYPAGYYQFSGLAWQEFCKSEGIE